MKKAILKSIFKVIGKIFGIFALVYGALFAVFFFDLDGKFLYYVWEPMMVKRYDKMERTDMTQTPYGAKEPVS
ncbi:MAG: hypothetical protein IJ744_11170 [Lachnospiraceae bacterium]|nr:hypothetical protein [Lachnospiraceae bacterium]